MGGVEATPAQLVARERFREAALYGKLVMADADEKALYVDAAKAKGKPVFSLTIADFFNAPSVDEVDLSAYTGAIGDEIIIMASDDFDVQGVEVSLSDEAGAPIESGAAVETPADSGRWLYTATTTVTTCTTVRPSTMLRTGIAVTASDRFDKLTTSRPGGVGSAEEEKAL